MSAWQGDWYRRVTDRLRERGYGSATEYVKARPTADFIELAHGLGEDVAAVQLKDVMHDEAGDDPQALREFAREVLTRSIFRIMPSGWGDDGEIARAYGKWAGYLGDRYDVATNLVFDALCALAPNSWRPTGPDDPLLLEAFKLWPADPLKPWKGDWRTRVTERARERGSPSVTSFVGAHPTCTFRELAEVLGPDDVAAAQVQDVMRDEAGEDLHALERLVRNLLVRDPLLAIAPSWEVAKTTIQMNLADYLGESYEGALDRVFAALEKLAPEGWRPTGPDDPLLLEAFKRWAR
jgi:hypothetical protein